MTTDPRSLIDELEEQRERLVALALSVPPELRKTPFVGKWSMHEVIAHLIGWDRTNITTVDALLAGRLPAFYDRYEPNWVGYNDELVATHRDDDWDALMQELSESQTAALLKLRSLSAEALTQPGPVWRTRPVTIAGILRFATKDEYEHLGQIEALMAGADPPR